MKIGPKYKICRRLGSRVFSKCQTTKFSISGSDTSKKGSGARARRGSRSPSLYGRQLLEKQKVRYAYGLKERQLANYIKGVRRQSGKDSAELLYDRLECRLDNVVYRLGLVSSRLFARQIVTHGHIIVNDRRLNIPSYEVRVGDKIGVKLSSAKSGIFQNTGERWKGFQPPSWLTFSPEALCGEVVGQPSSGGMEADLNLRPLIEFYSRA